MPKKSRTTRNRKTKKQKIINMIGCSKKHRHNKSCSKKNLGCPNCGPDCYCGPNCKCPHPCQGKCYLNRKIIKKGGSGCGSCGCPIGGLTSKQMSQFGGNDAYPSNVGGGPVIIAPPDKGFQRILGIGQNGGNCAVCGQTQVVSQSGGNFFKEIGPMPGPEIGNPWGANLKWPTVDSIGGDRNYFKDYNTDNNPQQQMSMNGAGYLTKNSMVGGYTYDKNTKSASKSVKSASKSVKSKRGGGLIPQDLVNLGRDFSYNFKSTYNTLNGYKPPVDPAPYKDQLTGALNNNRFML